jgi:hypothetical protein
MEKQGPQFYNRKMNIFFPDIHITLTRNTAVALSKLGHSMVLPSKDYEITRFPPQNWIWNDSYSKDSIEKCGFPPETKVVNKEELFDLKPEVIFVTAFENQFEVLDVIWPKAKEWGAKLVFYSGNDYWDTAYPWNIIENYLPADKLAASICEQKGTHYLHYKPWVDYKMFSFDGVSDSNLIGTYIDEYKNNFPEDFKIYETIKQHTSNFAEYKSCEGVSKEITAEVMNESCFTLHVKKLEGYGFAIIESMARGRPVFFWDPQTANKSYLQWSVLETTAFSFLNSQSYEDQAKKMILDEEYRHSTQTKCASKIREIIDNEEQNEKLNTFLNNLR